MFLWRNKQNYPISPNALICSTVLGEFLAIRQLNIISKEISVMESIESSLYIWLGSTSRGKKKLIQRCIQGICSNK